MLPYLYISGIIDPEMFGDSKQELSLLNSLPRVWINIPKYAISSHAVTCQPWWLNVFRDTAHTVIITMITNIHQFPTW